ncbi:hypothetical protein [Polaromonas sp.]|uniref:hypothetical protein n=1 Tax=Polaromonas sp. TaxID=1869339 RepID=UPI002487844D|nr:hypothetical protein [Polaromonas sp.]MDI1339362.1 hypothetical protein [Polaromonas sp.]
MHRNDLPSVQSGAKTPKLNTVLVWVTFTIERDYIERGAFPALRSQNAVIQHGSSSLHYMSAKSVAPILADARSRAAETSRGLRNSYNAFHRSLDHALKEAEERPALFHAPAAVCTYKHEGYSERWRGTKQQLKEMGIVLDGPWPNEEGGKERWAKAKDSKGRDSFITAYSKTWGGLFEVRIEIPERERRAALGASELEKKRALAQANLDSLPADRDDFRMELANDLRRILSVVIPTSPVAHHGFALTEDAVEAILMSADAVVEAIFQAEVSFDKAKHKAIELRYQQQIAECDQSFQQVLGQLTAVRPEMLERSAA